ncbi:MAG: exonuclease domain-containing protein [Clostridium argentinense]|nr:exonuclease domain-containing protein [Clostridium argentinense]
MENQQRHIMCYYSIKFNADNGNSKGLFLIINEKKLIFKSRENFNVEDLREAHIKCLKCLIAEIERLEIKGKITPEDKVYINTDSKSVLDKINEILYGFRENKCSIKKLSKIALNLQWHRNWNLVFNKNNSKDLYKFLKEFYGNTNKVKSTKKKNKENTDVKNINKILENDDLDIIFFDFEMNCTNAEGVNNEIISIGAVRHSSSGNEVFYSYIKPSFNCILSDRCKALTNIEQEEINTAEYFGKVFSKFENWVGEKKVIFISWGNDDIRAFKRDVRLNKCNLPIVNKMVNNYGNLQAVITKHLNSKTQVSLINALKAYNIQFEGHQHNALDDAVNLGKLYVKFKEELKNKEVKKSSN